MPFFVLPLILGIITILLIEIINRTNKKKMNKAGKFLVEKCGSIQRALNVCNELLDMYKNLNLIVTNLNQQQKDEYNSKIEYYTYLVNYYNSRK